MYSIKYHPKLEVWRSLRVSCFTVPHKNQATAASSAGEIARE